MQDRPDLCVHREYLEMVGQAGSLESFKELHQYVVVSLPRGQDTFGVVACR